MGDNIIKNSEIEETNSINSDEEDVKTCIDTNIKDILSNIQNLNKKKNKKVELKCCKKVKTCKKKAKDKKKKQKEGCDEDVSDESVSVDSTSSSEGSDDTDKDSSIYDKDRKTDNSDNDSDSDSDSDSESCSDSCSESDSCDDDENDKFFEHSSGVTNEGLGEMFHSVFVDNSGVTIAESLSSIATELHKLNNNIKKSYKNK